MYLARYWSFGAMHEYVVQRWDRDPNKPADAKSPSESTVRRVWAAGREFRDVRVPLDGQSGICDTVRAHARCRSIPA